MSVKIKPDWLACDGSLLARRVSPACQNLLNTSERASQQWGLEGDYARFETGVSTGEIFP
jgi:hypothetical protein